MEKTRADILIEKSKKNYSSAVQLITDLYDNVFAKSKDFRYEKRQVLSDYDCYLQAVLIKICAVRNRFLADEMNFIENIAGCVKDMSDRLLSEAEERLKIIPICFKLAGAVDASKNTSSMRALLDCTVKIAFNLKLIDPSADVKDNSDIMSAFNAVYAFARGNGISLK